MTTLPPPGLLGAQRPKNRSVPPAVTSAGREAVELAASAGLHLDPWQGFALDDALGERQDGKWSAFEVGIVVPRQNGKGGILEARELAGLFLFDEKLILHSSHEFKTSAEAFRRILGLIESTDHLRKRVKKIRTSHGEEGIELHNGARLRFVARSTGSGRGFSGDLVILDEAYNLSPDGMAALLPTLSARPNPQIWYTSSAPLVGSDVLRKVCQRGRAGDSGRLAYLEWCAGSDAASGDRAAWAEANPALGIRIDPEFVAAERAALGDEEFRRERLGIWGAEDEAEQVIDMQVWSQRADPRSRAGDPVAFVVDVTPDRSAAAVGAGSLRADGRWHGEVVDHRPGMGWVVERTAGLVSRWKPCAVGLDPYGPAQSLVGPLEAKGITVHLLNTGEVAQACGQFYDDVMNDRFRHLDQVELTAALAGAKKRPLGDGAWAWSRKSSAVDISPLVAVTLARFLHTLYASKPYDLMSSVQVG